MVLATARLEGLIPVSVRWQRFIDLCTNARLFLLSRKQGLLTKTECRKRHEKTVAGLSLKLQSITLSRVGTEFERLTEVGSSSSHLCDWFGICRRPNPWHCKFWRSFYVPFAANSFWKYYHLCWRSVLPHLDCCFALQLVWNPFADLNSYVAGNWPDGSDFDSRA